MAIGLAMIFVYMVLAAQFESFVQPIVIMLVPADLGAVRAVHAVGDRADAEPLERAGDAACCSASSRRTRFCRWTTANTLRAEGVPLREAIVEACRTRLRPILMTTFRDSSPASFQTGARAIGIGGG